MVKNKEIKIIIMKSGLVNILFVLAFLCPSILSAQEQEIVNVDRSKYPDYSRVVNPDNSLRVHKGVRKSSTRSERPEYVNNAETRYFPPVFNQAGGSCGSASRISYMFSYELAAYRDLDGSKPENYYPSHFVWLHTNSPGMQGKDDFVVQVGVPSAATYGGQTYSSLFGDQDAGDKDFGWMQGYDKWFEAMHNRMLAPKHFPMTLETEEGREAVKNWLWNHNGDDSFKSGGICGIGVASNGVWEKISSTDVNDKIGVTNKYYVRQWGETVDHALTIVGYDDRIEFDLDNDGVYGEVAADELGAWIIVNSWGEWCNDGLIYCPYAYAGTAFRKNSAGEPEFNGDFWQPEIYHVRKDYRPLRTIKLEMEYSRRSEIALLAGISANIDATEPDATIPFVHFTYAGDGNGGTTNPAPGVPMLGRWADGKLHKEPMEFGYDLTDLTAGFDKNKPLKYFFIIETKSWARGKGLIHKASIMDYEHDKECIEIPFDLGDDGVEIRNAGNKTIISVVVQSGGYNAPQNLSFVDNVLSWQAPLRSVNSVESYNVFCNGVLLANVAADVFAYTPDVVAESGEYSVSAVYSDQTESSKASVAVPITVSAQNKGVDFAYSGFTIPDVFKTKYTQATIEYWIKPKTFEAWGQQFGPGWYSFRFNMTYGGRIWVGWEYNNNHLCETTSNNSLKENEWAHIAVVVDNNKLNLYINGEKAANVTSPDYSGIGGFGDLVFLADPYYSAQNAVYDEIRIWKTALTQEQVNVSKNVEYSGHLLPEDLLAYFKGDLITGADGVQRMNDCVGGHHATFLNSSYSVVTNDLPTYTISDEDPVASINVPQEIFVGIPFDVTATYNSVVNKLEWSIVDAGIEKLVTKSPTVMFTTPGSHTIEVKAVAANGKETVVTLDVEVLDAPEIDAPFSMTAEVVPAGERVTFLANNPLPGYIYEWYMPGADKENVSSVNVGVTYNVPGDYKVVLTVTAPDGSEKSGEGVITVMEVAPKAAFSVSPSVVLKGETFALVDETLYKPTEWNWHLSSDNFNYIVYANDTVIALNEPGVYDVTLSVANEMGSDKTIRERALIVCNADSKNGLAFAKNSSEVVLEEIPFEAAQSGFTIDWWMNVAWPEGLCNGIGENESTMILKTNTDKSMRLFIDNMVVSSTSEFVIPDEWHHYAVTFNMSSVKFYRDGVLFNTIIHDKRNVPQMGAFKIGGAESPFCGSIDEFRLWGKTLGIDKIREYANAPIADVQLAEETDKLLVYYQFNQNGGDVLDATANKNHGKRVDFGPDGDAWGLSKGVFSLNFNGNEGADVTAEYLVNYRKAFKYDSKTCVNSNLATRTFALNDWNIENTVVSGGIVTGAHVDKGKSSCFTVTTHWDSFASSLSNHKVYQTIELPAGYYSFEVDYDDTYEGQCGNSYMVAALGETLPVTEELDNSISYKAMIPKGGADNKLEFFILEKSTVSLGLLVNMSGSSCMAIQRFTLKCKDFVIIGAPDVTGVISMPVDEVAPVEDIVYDLQGRRVVEMQKGVYIVNGKKVVK